MFGKSLKRYVAWSKIIIIVDIIVDIIADALVHIRKEKGRKGKLRRKCTAPYIN